MDHREPIGSKASSPCPSSCSTTPASTPISGIWIVTNRKQRKRRAVNPRDNFAYVFDPKFEELVMNRMDRNNEQVVKFLEDPQLKSFITSRFRNQVYDRIQAEMKSRINIHV